MFPTTVDINLIASRQVEIKKNHILRMTFVLKSKGLAKYRPFYTNKNLGYEGFNLKMLEPYEMWYAEYQEKPSFHYQFDMWQYTENDKVPGIETNVDINFSFKDYANS